jgi:dienelactone hydrolase
MNRHITNSYARWMDAWETRLAFRSTNRVVRPFEWGLEWCKHWPLSQEYPRNGHTEEQYLAALNQRAIADSRAFFGYRTPADYRLEGDLVSFTSPVWTPHAENNTAYARWFPARTRAGTRSRKAIVLLPHWNAHAAQHVALCRAISKLGISVLRISLPYHDRRLPAETERSDYAVSSNIGRTMDATRQAVIDVRCCFDWLEQQGYHHLGIVGTSLGSCYAFLASAHDERIGVNVFNHCSTYFADVVWTGLSTRHIRQAFEGNIDIDGLRQSWMAISPVSYIEKYAQKRKKSLFTYATLDTTFLPELSRDILARIQSFGVDHRVVALPCGHYTLGETPYKFIVGYHICSFLARQLGTISG